MIELKKKLSLSKYYMTYQIQNTVDCHSRQTQ